MHKLPECDDINFPCIFPADQIWSFILSGLECIIHHLWVLYIGTSQCEQYHFPIGLIIQLVEHCCTGIHRGRGFESHSSLNFFSGFVFTAAWCCNLWWSLMSSYLILGSSNILSFIYLLAFFTSKGILHTHKLSCQLPVGLIAQLVGHCTSIRRGHGMGLNPFQAWPFSGLKTLPLLINNWYNYNDCLCLYIFLCSSKTWLFKYSFAN